MFLGIDLGGTNLKIGIINNSNNVIFQRVIPTNAQKGYKSLLDRILFYVDKALSNYQNIKSIGIGVPGWVSDKGIIKICPNLPEWVNINLKPIFKKNFKLPFAIDNDANTGALAEMEIGAGTNSTHFIYVTLGTGIGGAIVIDRQIYKGVTGGAGEIGHTIIDFNSRINEESPYRSGVLETFIGKNQISEFAFEYLKGHPDSTLNEAPKIDPYYISQCAAEGDQTSIEILERVGFCLGIGLSTLMNILDISMVIVGGGISECHPTLFESALATIRTRALPPIAKRAKIVKGQFTKNAGIIGAALLGKEEYQKIDN